jgi:hypothetical protein
MVSKLAILGHHIAMVTQNNKLSLIGMQLPEKYKEKFDFSSEGPSYLRKLLNILYFCIRAKT